MLLLGGELKKKYPTKYKFSPTELFPISVELKKESKSFPLFWTRFL